jgi:hypothetical protein
LENDTPAKVEVGISLAGRPVEAIAALDDASEIWLAVPDGATLVWVSTAEDTGMALLESKIWLELPDGAVPTDVGATVLCLTAELVPAFCPPDAWIVVGRSEGVLMLAIVEYRLLLAAGTTVIGVLNTAEDATGDEVASGFGRTPVDCGTVDPDGTDGREELGCTDLELLAGSCPIGLPKEDVACGADVDFTSGVGDGCWSTKVELCCCCSGFEVGAWIGVELGRWAGEELDCSWRLDEEPLVETEVMRSVEVGSGLDDSGGWIGLGVKVDFIMLLADVADDCGNSELEAPMDEDDNCLDVDCAWEDEDGTTLLLTGAEELSAPAALLAVRGVELDLSMIFEEEEEEGFCSGAEVLRRSSLLATAGVCTSVDLAGAGSGTTDEVVAVWFDHAFWRRTGL